MTTWTRIEPVSRTIELTGGLEARIADPLWLLARQWQVGEFHGDDAAQPCAAEVGYRSAPVDLPAGRPADAAVAAAPPAVRGSAGLHTGVRAGYRLTRLLIMAGLSAAAAELSDAFRPVLDDDALTGSALGAARCGLLLRHGLDGVAVAAASPAEVAAALAKLSAADRERATAIIDAWATGFRDELAGSVPGTWDDERLEHAFDTVAAPVLAPVTLHAPEYPGGGLDWSAFDLASPDGPAIAPVVLPQHPVRRVSAIPTPVRYNGMPVSRWFEFEDGRVNFGELEAGPADVARLLVAEFATSYSEDWFLIPLGLGVGTLTEVSSLTVTDNFGATTPVFSTALTDGDRLDGDRPWRLFELAGDEISAGHPAPWLLIPPTAAGDLTGPPVERVVLARDEAANLAWGIEQLIEGPAGRAIDRAALGGAARSAPPTDELWRYRLEAPAPPWWIPFVPERITAGRPDIRLRRARMESWELLDGVPVGPQSELLDPDRPVWIREEEVPATGVVVERRWRYARWSDGSTHLWLERAKRPSGGNRSSGVRWDIIA